MSMLTFLSLGLNGLLRKPLLDDIHGLRMDQFHWTIYQESEKIFDYLCNCTFLGSRTFDENFKFLKNCPYDFDKN